MFFSYFMGKINTKLEFLYFHTKKLINIQKNANFGLKSDVLFWLNFWK